jgi:hypothetical protein
MHTKKLIRLLAVLVAFAASVVPAAAQASRIGATTPVIFSSSRGSAVAFGNGVYLVVSAMGIVNGRFVAADGTPLGSQFVIQTTTNYAAFPRVAFSPDADGGAGAFLVTWGESVVPDQVHARLVSYLRGGPLGADVMLGLNPFSESGRAVAYSTTSQEFLIVWENTSRKLVGVRVGNAAQVLGSIAFPVTADGERDPSVAYNPDDNQFLVVYTGWNSTAFASARRIQAGTGAVLDQTSIVLARAGGTYISDVTYIRATHKYLASWYALPDNASLGQLVNPDGTMTGGTIILSTRWKAYDALSVDSNPVSGTAFLVSHSSTAEDGGVELKSDGVPVDNGFIVTAAGGNGNFYPRIAASTTGPDWLVSTANNFTTTMVQLIRTATSSCAVSVSPGSFSLAGGGGAGTITVTAATPCSWTAASSASWLTITSGASGTTSGAVTFSAAVNTGPTRTATIVVGGQVVTVTQTGCTYALGTPAISLPAGGGRNLQFTITTSASCAWTAQASVGWIATSSSGTGNGTVVYTAIRNPTSFLRGGQNSVGGVYFLVFEAGATRNDFNDDGRPDILFRNNVTGELTTWSMNINQQLSSAAVPQDVDLNWRVVGVSDMDRDGQSDIIWRNSATGAGRVWLMDGSSILGEHAMTGVASANWNVVGSGDFDADGTPDLVWQDDSNGDIAIWLMQRELDGSFTFKDTRIIGRVGTSWKVRGVADFNRDLIPDLVFQDTTAGWIAVWFMGPNGASVRDTRYFTLDGVPQRVDPNWRIAGVGDFNNDLRADLLWQHTNGWLAMWLTWDNFVLDTRYLVNASGVPIRFTGLNLNWQIVGPR